MTVSQTRTRNIFAGPGSNFTLTLDYDSADDLELYVNLVRLASTAYTITGAALHLVSALTGGQTLLVRRRTPRTQPVTYRDNDNFPAETHQGVMDRLCLGNQEARDNVRRGVGGGPATGIIPAPQPNLVLAGTAAGGLTHATLADLAGGTPTLLAVNQGGTGSSTASAARTALGIGDAATKDAGGASGQVPILNASATVDGDAMPVVTGFAAGVPPAYVSSAGQYAVAQRRLSGLDGWGQFRRRVPLKQVSGTGTVASLDMAATSTEWDTYEDFEFEIVYTGNTSTANNMTGVFKIGASWITTAAYVCSWRSQLLAVGFGSAGSSTAATTFILAPGTPPSDVDYIMVLHGRIKNGYVVSTSMPARIEMNMAGGWNSTGSKLAVGHGGASCSTLGLFRGLRAIASSGSSFLYVRMRLWGLTNHTFPS